MTTSSPATISSQATADQAFEIADRAMIDTLRAYCACVTPTHLVPTDTKDNVVMKVADAHPRAVEAFGWLSARGLASIGEGKSGMSGQHIVLSERLVGALLDDFPHHSAMRWFHAVKEMQSLGATGVAEVSSPVAETI